MVSGAQSDSFFYSAVLTHIELGFSGETARVRSQWLALDRGPCVGCEQ